MKNELSPKPSFKYAGFLVTYGSSNRRDITQINHLLFGRVVTIQKENRRERYYYPGMLEQLGFKKVTNGCYFIKERPQFPEDGEDSRYTKTLVLINFIPAIVEFPDDAFLTGRQYWEDKIKGNVHNW